MEVTMKLPKIIRPYSFGEEVGNAISHGVMALVVLGGIAPSAIHAFNKSGPLAAVGTSILA